MWDFAFIAISFRNCTFKVKTKSNIKDLFRQKYPITMFIVILHQEVKSVASKINVEEIDAVELSGDDEDDEPK